MEHRLSVDGSGAASEPHGNGGRKGDDSRQREGQAVVHHEGHCRRVEPDTGMPWMHGDPEVPRRELSKEVLVSCAVCLVPSVGTLRERNSRSTRAELTPPVQCEALVSSRSCAVSTCCSPVHVLTHVFFLIRTLLQVLRVVCWTDQHHSPPPPRAARGGRSTPELACSCSSPSRTTPLSLSA